MIDMQGGLEIALGGNGARPFKFKIELTLPQKLASYGTTQSQRINTLCKSTTIPGSRMTQRGFWDNGHMYNLPSTKVYDTEWTGSFYLDDSYTIRMLMEKWIALFDYYNGQKYSDVPITGDVLGTVADIAGQALQGVATQLSGMADNAINTASSFINDTFGTSLGRTNIAGTALVADVEDGLTGFLKGEDVVSYNDSQATIFGSIKITQLDITNSEICTYVLYDAYPLSIQQIGFDDTRIDTINDFTVTFSFSRYEIVPSGGLLNDLENTAVSKIKSLF
jgi:hypothetical protein